jgi:hypothetical protein
MSSIANWKARVAMPGGVDGGRNSSAVIACESTGKPAPALPKSARTKSAQKKRQSVHLQHVAIDRRQLVLAGAYTYLYNVLGWPRASRRSPTQATTSARAARASSAEAFQANGGLASTTDVSI